MQDVTELYKRDSVIADLRRYVIDLEKRVTQHAESAAAAPALVEAPLLALPAASPELPAIASLEMQESDEPLWARDVIDVAALPEDDFQHQIVARVMHGEFLVHPRPKGCSVGWIGPFEGAIPCLLSAGFETRHVKGPPLYFHCSITLGAPDKQALLEKVDVSLERPECWIASEAQVKRRIVAAAPAPANHEAWGVLFVVRPVKEGQVDFGWATFFDVKCHVINAQGQRRVLTLT